MEIGLSRRVNRPLLIFFGVGTMVGAGIFVLIGEIVAASGTLAPLAFLLAAVVAGFTARSYGELSSHFPKAAGEAEYVRQAFDRRPLAAATGWAVIVSGVVSSAALANGFANYLPELVALPRGIALTLFLAALGAVAVWGIRETMWVAALVTAASLCGLLLVLVFTGRYLDYLPQVAPELLPTSGVSLIAIATGAFIAFYAFIGFEDMVNVAEEVLQPEQVMASSILWALAIATVLYVLVALATVLASQALDLTGHPAPLAEMVRHAGGNWAVLVAVFSLLSVTNGALAQIIMVSRVLYGMARAGGAPSVFARIHPERHTPALATVITVAVILALALWFPLVTLAKVTSLVILLVFALVNLSLIRLKRSGRLPKSGLWVPVTGLVLTLLLMGASLL